MEAVRSADVLLSSHGAEGAHFIFMRDNTSFVEVYPFEYMRLYEGSWTREFFPKVTAWMDSRVRLYGLSIEDPALSEPSHYEEGGWLIPDSPRERDR